MILKVGMQHQVLEAYNVYINKDYWLTLSFLRQGQIRLPMYLHGENGYKVI